MSGEGFMHLGEVREMRRITEEYWNPKTDDSTATFDMSADVLESVDETPGQRTLMTGRGTLATVASTGVNIGFKTGRFRLTKG